MSPKPITMACCRPPCFLLQFLFASLLLFLFSSCLADVGTAAYYGPPYLRKTYLTSVYVGFSFCSCRSWFEFVAATVCYGGDASQFPAYGMFAAAGEGIWDNSASCGREYAVRCLSSAMPRACISGQTIQVKIVDRACMLNSMPSRNGTTLVLSTAAFQMIANRAAGMINIEFTQ